MQGIKNGLGSKKAIACGGAFLVASGLLWAAKLTPDHWVEFCKWDLVAYLTGQAAVDGALAIKGKIANVIAKKSPAIPMP